jgi:hypothetical protein
MGKQKFPFYLGKEYVNDVFLLCLETKIWIKKLQSKQWLRTNEQVPGKKILNSSNKIFTVTLRKHKVVQI